MSVLDANYVDKIGQNTNEELKAKVPKMRGEENPRQPISSCLKKDPLAPPPSLKPL